MIFGTTAQSLVDFATLKADCEDSRFNAQCASGICNDKTSKFKVWKDTNGQSCEYDDQCIRAVDKYNSKLKICDRGEHREECYTFVWLVGDATKYVKVDLITICLMMESPAELTFMPK
jgi:hypothetical protein